MKNKLILRIVGIGIFHAVLYLYIVPFVIYPKFGNYGFKFTIVIAIIISIAVLGTMFLKKNKGDKNE
ncbi:MAG: hypothetical protein K8S18_13495 [Desulfobacula sp.]|nr:hypothetical protein [Desulfobacula sp.]MCK5163910.1 hypothetical protein [Desulfobacula sp.]